MDTHEEYSAPPRPSAWRVVGFIAVIALLAGVIGGFTAAITSDAVMTAVAAAVVVVIGALWLPRVWRGTPAPEHRAGERPGYEQYGPLGQPNTAGLGAGGNAGGPGGAGGGGAS